MANEITAVNKLYIYLLGIVSFDSEQLRNLYEESFEKAKQMEKEQMFEFWKGGQDSMEEGGKSFEQYYNETYGK
jgi:hypothetical protein